MCTCNAYTYNSCPYEHCKFETVSLCMAVRLKLRPQCQRRILNGHPDIVRLFPVIDGICHVCYPEKAKAEEEEEKMKEKTHEAMTTTIAEEKEETEKHVAQTQNQVLSGISFFPDFEPSETPIGEVEKKALLISPNVRFTTTTESFIEYEPKNPNMALADPKRMASLADRRRRRKDPLPVFVQPSMECFPYASDFEVPEGNSK